MVSPMKELMLKDEQFVTDAKGKPIGVLLGLKTYARLREAEKDLADIRAYDAARPKVMSELQAGQFSTLADYRSKRAKARCLCKSQ